MARTKASNGTFNLGSFEGFNFRSHSAIEQTLTAEDVIDWDHDAKGEAEFWPSGDSPEISLLFEAKREVTASDLISLDRLLGKLGGDLSESLLRIHYAVNVCGAPLHELTVDAMEDQCLHIFFGENFTDLRAEAAYELFELFYPEAFAIWEKTLCDGLVFDTDRFLDSPAWSVEEVRLAASVALIVAPQ